MRILIQRLKRKRKKLRHLRYLKTTIWDLKYEILNSALKKEINENKINLFHKYHKRLKLITFLSR